MQFYSMNPQLIQCTLYIEMNR